MLRSFHSRRQNSPEAALDTIFDELSLLVASLDDGSQHTPETSTSEASLLPISSLSEKDQKPARVIKIFISFDEADEKLLQGLMRHLFVMQREYLRRENCQIVLWHSGNIQPGEDWKKKIEWHLKEAHVILLLVSVDFLSSELCQSIEIQPALNRHKAHEAYVIPVILSPCRWQFEDFGSLRALPPGGKPVVKWRPYEDAYFAIVNGVCNAIDNLLRPKEGF